MPKILLEHLLSEDALILEKGLIEEMHDTVKKHLELAEKLDKKEA